MSDSFVCFTYTAGFDGLLLLMTPSTQKLLVVIPFTQLKNRMTRVTQILWTLAQLLSFWNFLWCDYIMFSRLADKDYAAVTSMSWADYGVTTWMGLKIFHNFLIFRVEEKRRGSGRSMGKSRNTCIWGVAIAGCCYILLFLRPQELANGVREAPWRLQAAAMLQGELHHFHLQEVIWRMLNWSLWVCMCRKLH
nr:uncharacterized protein LOC127326984 [Lolium perenne]XP_051209728.1 uncharacterized protein LOC127326984 [Lolium perenne]